MSTNAWTRWPSREALAQAGLTRARRVLSNGVRYGAVTALLWSSLAQDHRGTLASAVVLLWAVGCVLAARGLYQLSLAHRLWPSVAMLVLLLVAGGLGRAQGLDVASLVVWCGCAIAALERLPLAAALPVTTAGVGCYIAYDNDGWLTTLITAVGLVLAGYVVRLEAEARGGAQRLLEQERAARVAEAESAALAERARIAREIHDVLAHSLSAQMVHLEAARLLIERDADRGQILERVVDARRMARDGLAETRHALSALRGEMTPLEQYLKELAGSTDGAEVTISGDRRPLAAEASQAVRRVAQEALTNARKHAPGATVAVVLTYGDDDVTLDVKDTGGAGAGELAATGGGYGLRGMRERAELLGGTLAAGPHEEGFAVTLKVPA